MGKFLHCRLLAMYVMCEVHEKRRCVICCSLDIVTFALIQSADLTSKGHPRSKVKVKLKRQPKVSY